MTFKAIEEVNPHASGLEIVDDDGHVSQMILAEEEERKRAWAEEDEKTKKQVEFHEGRLYNV